MVRRMIIGMHLGNGLPAAPQPCHLHVTLRMRTSTCEIV
jgi:hypothetical protein